MGRFLALLVLLAPALAAALTFVDGEIAASGEQTFAGTPLGGYAPVWIELQNKSARPSEVEVRFRAYAPEGRVTRTVRLDPGEKRVVGLPVPTNMAVGQVELFRDGDKLAGSLSVNVQSGNGPAVLALGTSAEWNDAFGGEEQNEHPPLIVEPRHAPDLLAGYIGYSAVVVLEDASRLPAASRSALEAAVKAGAHVLFAGAGAAQPSLDRWRANEALAEPATYGFGRIATCGRGECRPYLQAAPRAVRTESEGDSFYGTYDPGDAPSMLPEIGQTPVGAFLVIILLFAIAIGPLNFAFASRRGRHLMLLTIPALAATTCAGIAGYGIASDGLFSKHFSAYSVTWLDAEAHDATTLAVTASYAALSPGTVHFPANLVLAAQSERVPGTSLDWTNGLAVGGNFLPSRTYREHAYIVNAPSRARVTVHAGKVENALGGTVTRIILREQGRLFVAGPVAEGASAELAPLPDSDGLVTRPTYARRFTTPLLDEAFALPEEGSFAAELEGAPFAPDAGMSPTRHKVAGIVIGRISR